MRKFLFFISILLSIGVSFAKPVTIKGLAPSYVGSSIKVYKITDYFSNIETLITSSIVKPDSTFLLTFSVPITQKIIVKSNNNKGFIFVQKGGIYDLFIPKKDKYSPYKPTGNDIEIGFFGLDSTDINYKILGFQRWIYDFIGNNYYKKNIEPLVFSKNLDRFKSNVEQAYKEDTSSYFKTHVRFSIAGLDNIQTNTERGRHEKYNFYIKYSPVQYNNEVYMSYISSFYQNMIPRLPIEVNKSLDEGILKSSPTLIMKALGAEYTLINLRIRELIMIKALSEIYNSNEFPQVNISTILDSLSNKCLFKANQEIAKNLTYRIQSLVPGGKAPDILFTKKDEDNKTLYNYKGKHLYIHFFDPQSKKSKEEIPLLIELFSKYSDYVQFVSVYKTKKVLSEEAKELIKKISWDVYTLSESNPLWESYSIEAYPQYTLIDAFGYIVASPALSPKPNGQYETIDKTFFYIKRTWDNNKGLER
jgi:hypothetical protein